MPFRLPTEHERRAEFAALKRQSSLSMWTRVLDLHRAFMDAVEAAFQDGQRHPSPDPDLGTFIPVSWMSSVFQAHDALARAVDRLRDGDRTCFKFLGVPGHISEGIQTVNWWDDMYGREIHMGGPIFPPARSPHWPTIEAAMQACLAAYYELEAVVEPRELDVPAKIESIDELLDPRLTPYATIFRGFVAQPSLPDVPVIDPPVLVPSGESIPCAGIFEPVRTHAQRSDVRDMVRRWLAREDFRIEGIDGCMNYLCRDSPAPTIAFPEDGLRKEGRPTLWRLTWADDRYGRHGVPSDE